MATLSSSLRAQACRSTCTSTSAPFMPARQPNHHSYHTVKVQLRSRLSQLGSGHSPAGLQHLHTVPASCCAQHSGDVLPVPDLMMPKSDIECDRKWIAGMVAMWLDEEWTPLKVHQQLGKAAGDAYTKCRQQGDDDMSSLVLGISNELLAFNYRETFTNAFEVANKVVEMLMMRSGVDVCCTTDEDAARIERYNSQSSTDA